MAERLKVLVAAYACSPHRGSEAGVGWGWVEAISQRHDLWVLVGETEPGTDIRYREEIEAELARRPELKDRVRFYFLDKPHWPRLMRVWPPAYLWSYRVWQRKAYELAVQLHGQIGFDLVHQITYVGYRVPGELWKLDIPFVWGPIGGLENTAWRFLPSLGLRGSSYYAARNVINSLHRRYLPAPKKAFRKAEGGIIAATEGIRREIRKWYGVDSDVICEIGPSRDIAATHARRGDGEPLKLAWSGMHEPGKALPFLLKALASLPKAFPWELTILGVGRSTAQWQALARRLSIHDRCRWTGWIPREQAVASLANSHVFVITSMKDLTSTVLLEALSQGLPVICPDHCGFANVITPNCGLKIPVVTPAQFQSDLANKIQYLADDEMERRRLAAGALKRIEDFSWPRKAEQVEQIYQRVMAHQAMADPSLLEEGKLLDLASR